jgi:hypothetical protein
MDILLEIISVVKMNENSDNTILVNHAEPN